MMIWKQISLTRISIPVPVMYSHVFDNGSMLFAGAGPNFMYSFSGKYKYGSESQKIEFGSGEEQMKPFDIGLHLKAGYQFAPGLVLSSFFNAGFTNLNNWMANNLNRLMQSGSLLAGCLEANLTINN
jgi:hypothetical protein